jgi:DNA replication and repair protein RecF
MHLTELSVACFRNLESVQLQPVAGINVIFGENASGKTSLLEAIHFLARVRSFRTTRPQQLVMRGCDALMVRGVMDHGSRLAIRWAPERTEVRIDQEDVRSLSVLARHLPIQVVNSESQRLLQDGPQVRRSFLDWGLFHVEQSFYDSWRRYDRALRQRNHALRTGDERLARSWEPELVAQADVLTEQRSRFIEELGGHLSAMLLQWLPDEDVTLAYRTGWPAGRSLSEVFDANRGRERELGYTLYGPHRGDLLIRSQGVEAQHRLSRGQQKLLVIGLLLAATRLAQGHGGAITLIDDLPAELDANRREEVLAVLLNVGAQVFVTSTDRESIPLEPGQAGWFHVEHGHYRKVV